MTRLGFSNLEGNTRSAAPVMALVNVIEEIRKVARQYTIHERQALRALPLTLAELVRDLNIEKLSEAMACLAHPAPI
jgi:hypothetical protein